MKISKQAKKVQATGEVIPTPVVPAPDTTTVCQPSEVAEATPYEQAKCYIQSAIGALTSVAPTDQIAKDSIANLAVVLMDLQGA